MILSSFSQTSQIEETRNLERRGPKFLEGGAIWDIGIGKKNTAESKRCSHYQKKCDKQAWKIFKCETRGELVWEKSESLEEEQDEGWRRKTWGRCICTVRCDTREEEEEEGEDED